MTQTERNTLNRLAEAPRSLDRKLAAAKDPAQMRRLTQIRKSLRIMMEPLARK